MFPFTIWKNFRMLFWRRLMHICLRCYQLFLPFGEVVRRSGPRSSNFIPYCMAFLAHKFFVAWGLMNDDKSQLRPLADDIETEEVSSGLTLPFCHRDPCRCSRPFLPFSHHRRSKNTNDDVCVSALCPSAMLPAFSQSCSLSLGTARAVKQLATTGSRGKVLALWNGLIRFFLHQIQDASFPLVKSSLWLLWSFVWHFICTRLSNKHCWRKDVMKFKHILM